MTDCFNSSHFLLSDMAKYLKYVSLCVYVCVCIRLVSPLPTGPPVLLPPAGWSSSGKIQVQMCVCMYVCTYTVCLCVHMHTCVYTRWPAFHSGMLWGPTAIHLHHRHTYTHTHTHTHNQAISLLSVSQAVFLVGAPSGCTDR